MGLHSPGEKHAPATPQTKSDALKKEYAGSDVLSRHQDRSTDKCSTKECVSHRREMLLLNLSIKTQQDEIDRLHADLQRREQELQDKEDALAKEQRRFDQFLLSLDQEAQDLAEKLEQQQQAKADKDADVASLERELSIVSLGIKRQMDNIDTTSK